MPLAGGARFKPCELASHFRLQYLTGSVICFAVLILFGSWLWACVAFVCVVVNVIEIVPCYFNNPKTDNNKNPSPLRIVFANVLYLNKNHAPFIALIEKEKPDIFIVQELTESCLNEIESLKEDYPYSISRHEKQGGGIAVFSKLPFGHSEIISLGFENRQSILVKFFLGERSVTLYTFHPQAPLRPFYFNYRNQQLAKATKIIKQLDAPKIVVGDLNTTVWSPFFKRLLKETDLVNARQSFGLLPTFPVWKFPIKFLMLPIDHCLMSDDICVKQIRTGDFLGSDHLPVIIDLEL